MKVLSRISIGIIVCFFVLILSRKILTNRIYSKGHRVYAVITEVSEFRQNLANKKYKFNNFKYFINYSFVVEGDLYSSRKEILPQMSNCGLPVFEKNDSVLICYLPKYPSYNEIYFSCE